MTPKLTLKRMTRFVLSAVAAGAVVAVLLVPLGAAAGWGMGYASGSYAELPLDLQTPATAQTSYLYANDGKTLITTFYDQDRRDVPLSQVAKVMQQAIVSAEDSRFYLTTASTSAASCARSWPTAPAARSSRARPR